ncbi:LamG-like jellyroll fold domain-containing protein [Candidatus Omnitrophota bacterium]
MQPEVYDDLSIPTEYVNLELEQILNPNVFEDITVTETLLIGNPLEVNVFDTVIVVEYDKITLFAGINEGSDVFITEDVYFGFTIIELFAFDTASVLENMNIITDPQPFVFDEVGVEEFADRETGLFFVDVFEDMTTTVDEYVEMSIATLFPALAYEEVNIVENIYADLCVVAWSNDMSSLTNWTITKFSVSYCTTDGNRFEIYCASVSDEFISVQSDSAIDTISTDGSIWAVEMDAKLRFPSGYGWRIHIDNGANPIQMLFQYSGAYSQRRIYLNNVYDKWIICPLATVNQGVWRFRALAPVGNMVKLDVYFDGDHLGSLYQEHSSPSQLSGRLNIRFYSQWSGGGGGTIYVYDIKCSTCTQIGQTYIGNYQDVDVEENVSVSVFKVFEYFSVYDNVSVVEDVTTYFTSWSFGVYDEVSVLEGVVIAKDISVDVFDSVNVSEYVDRYEGLLFVSVFDVSSIVEDASLAPYDLPYAFGFDDVSIVEDVSGEVFNVIEVSGYDVVSVVDYSEVLVYLYIKDEEGNTLSTWAVTEASGHSITESAGNIYFRCTTNWGNSDITEDSAGMQTKGSEIEIDMRIKIKFEDVLNGNNWFQTTIGQNRWVGGYYVLNSQVNISWGGTSSNWYLRVGDTQFDNAWTHDAYHEWRFVIQCGSKRAFIQVYRDGDWIGDAFEADQLANSTRIMVRGNSNDVGEGVEAWMDYGRWINRGYDYDLGGVFANLDWDNVSVTENVSLTLEADDLLNEWDEVSITEDVELQADLNISVSDEVSIEESAEPVKTEFDMSVFDTASIIENVEFSFVASPELSIYEDVVVVEDEVIAVTPLYTGVVSDNVSIVENFVGDVAIIPTDFSVSETISVVENRLVDFIVDVNVFDAVVITEETSSLFPYLINVYEDLTTTVDEWVDLYFDALNLYKGLNPNTKLLLHFDGTEGQTSTVDSSGNNHTLYFVSDAELDSEYKVFGTTSLWLDTSDAVRTDYDSDFELGSGQNTLEFRVRIRENYTQSMTEIFQDSSNYMIYEYILEGGTTHKIAIYGYSGGQWLGFLYFDITSYFSLDAWHTIGIQHNHRTFRVHCDGHYIDSQTFGYDIYSGTNRIYIGKRGGNSLYANVDEYMWMKGEELWGTNDYTVATSPYGADTIPSDSVSTSENLVIEGIEWHLDVYDTSSIVENVSVGRDINLVAVSPIKLLLHFNGTEGQTTTVDSSDSGHIITVANGASLDTTYKVFGTASLETVPDYEFARTPYSSEFQIQTNDVTVEFRYRPRVTDTQMLMMFDGDSSNRLAIWIERVGGTTYTIKANLESGGVDRGTKSFDVNAYWSINAFHTVGIQFSNKVMYLHCDGNYIGSDNWGTYTLGTASPRLYIGRVSGFYNSNGNFDEFVFWQGVNKFGTSNYTVRTSEWTSDTILNEGISAVENVSLDTGGQPDNNVSVDDDISVVEDVNFGFISQIEMSVFDTSSIVENVEFSFVASPAPSVSDDVSAVEDVSLNLPLGLEIDVYESPSIVEYVEFSGLVLDLDVSVNEASSIVENIFAPPLPFSGAMTNAVLYFDFNGSDGSQTFVDRTGRHSVGFVGTGCELDTAQKKWGVSSCLFDGTTNGYFTMADSTDWDIGSGNFCIHAWVKHNSHTNDSQCYVNQYTDPNNRWQFHNDEVGSGLRWANTVANSGYIVVNGDTYISDTNWHHVLFVKVGYEYAVYLDGTQIAYLYEAVKTCDETGAMYIGRLGAIENSKFYMDGWIDDLVISQSNILGLSPNVGKTDTFTPPVRQNDIYDWFNPVINETPSIAEDVTLNAFIPPIESEVYEALSIVENIFAPPLPFSGSKTNSLMMMHFNGSDGSKTFTDETGRHSTLTIGSGCELDTAQKYFGNASCLFDGTINGYFTMADSDDWEINHSNNLGSYCIHFWVKHNSLTADYPMYLCHYTDGGHKWQIYNHRPNSSLRWTKTDTTGGTTFGVYGNVRIDDLNWHHVCFVKIGYEYGMYLDGSQIAYTYEDTKEAVAVGLMYVGKMGLISGSQYYLDGWLDEYVITKNNILGLSPVVGLTDSFTPPARPTDDEDWYNPIINDVSSITEWTVLGTEVLDILDSQIGFLAHFDGADASQVAPEESRWNANYTFVDGTTPPTKIELDTAQKKFGTASVLSPAKANYGTNQPHIKYDNTPAFDLGTNDFFMEVRWRRTNAWINTASYRIMNFSNGSAVHQFRFRNFGATTDAQFIITGGSMIQATLSGTEDDLDVWHTYVVLRKDNNWRMIFDGNVKMTIEADYVSYNGWVYYPFDLGTGHDLYFAGYTDPSTTFDGWLDEAIIINGSSVYDDDNPYVERVTAYDDPTPIVPKLFEIDVEEFVSAIVASEDDIYVTEWLNTVESIVMPPLPYSGAMTNALLYFDFNGTDASQTFVDRTGRHSTATVGSGCELDTAQKVFGSASCKFNGTTNGYFTIADSGDWTIGSGDYTIHFRAKYNSLTNQNQYWLGQYYDSSNRWQILNSFADNILYFNDLGNFSVVSTTYINDTNWHHILFMKKGQEYAIYLDGQQVAYLSSALTCTGNGGLLYFGKLGDIEQSQFYFDGWMEDVVFARSNLLGLSPNVGKTDSFTVPVREGDIYDWFNPVTNDIMAIVENTNLAVV